MTLFSWFFKSKKVTSPKNKGLSLEDELRIFNKNTMWPLAKVKNNPDLKVYCSNPLPSQKTVAPSLPSLIATLPKLKQQNS
jgi:hypothetical protein